MVEIQTDHEAAADIRHLVDASEPGSRGPALMRLATTIAALRAALEAATRERDESRAELDRMSGWIGKLRQAERERDAAIQQAEILGIAVREVTAGCDAALARLGKAEALLLDVWDSHHREGWEPTETFDSVMDRLSDWRWNNGFDPHNRRCGPTRERKGNPMSDAFKLGRIASLQAEMYVSVARIEGMKALNQWRESRGEAQAYDEAAFLDEGKTLAYIATSLREVADV